MRNLMFALAAMVVLIPGLALADSITVTYTLPTLTDFGTETGTPFAEFDPTLGTLNSVTTSVTIYSTFSGSGDMDINTVEDIVTFGTAGDTLMTPGGIFGDGTDTVPYSVTTSDATILAGFTGTGVLDPSVDVVKTGRSEASIVTAFSDESVTYNYTPAAAPVPEPASFGLVGAVLAGFVLSRRRKAV